jgi:hypothetical protein
VIDFLWNFLLSFFAPKIANQIGKLGWYGSLGTDMVNWSLYRSAYPSDFLLYARCGMGLRILLRP